MEKISLLILFYSSLYLQIYCRYPCLNEGEPILLGQNGNEFRCECLAGFFGPFCEYQDTSQTTDPKSGKISPHSSSSASNTPSSRGWESTFVNLLLCIFFLLLLPSIVVYAVRALYLFLKRCNSGPLANCRPQNQQTTPPPQYWAAMAEDGRMVGQNNHNLFGAANCGGNLRQWPPINAQNRLPNSPNRHFQRSERRRRRSESPVTEVTVQLPASFCRPLHGTHSAGPLLLHQTQSLTLNEFHELLLNIQREMVAQQQMDIGREQQMPNSPSSAIPPQSSNAARELLPPSHPPPPPPSLLEPPPNYELALSSTCSLR